MEPSATGMQLELSHLDTKLQNQVNALCATYRDAFKRGKYDINTKEGEFSCEKERILQPLVIKKIAPIMQNLIREGNFAPADVQLGFCSNINAVSKPVDNKVHSGRAGSHIAKLQGVKGNSQRITLDLRKINYCMPTDPKITFPNYKSLARQFAKCICSNFDLCSMFYAIPINYDSQNTTNFWYTGMVYKMQWLPMGLNNAGYVAQKAAPLTYSDAILEIYLQEKQIKKELYNLFYSVSEFLLIYLDNLCLFTPKGKEQLASISY